MKRVNVRFVVILVGALVVASGLVYLVHGYQTTRYATFFSKRAEQAETEGRMADALQFLDVYLALRPNDVEAQTHLGILLSDTGQDFAAFATLEKSLRQQDSVTARRKLVDVLVRLRRWRDAREHLEKFLLPAAPDDPQLLNQLGRCKWGMDDYVGAARTFHEAIVSDSRQVEGYLWLSRLLTARPEVGEMNQDGKREDSLSTLDKAIQANGDVVALYLTRARQEFGVLQYAPALQDIDRVLVLTQEIRQRLGTACQQLTEDQNVAGVLPVLRTIRQQLVTDQEAERLLNTTCDALEHESGGERLVNCVNRVEPILHRIEYETQCLGGECLLGQIGSLTSAEGDLRDALLKKARGLAGAAISLIPSDERGYRILARVEISAGDRHAAIECLQSGVRASEASTILPITLAALQIEDDQLLLARETIKGLAKLRVASSIVAYLNGRAFLADGKAEQAIQAFEAARLDTSMPPDLAKDVEYWLGRSYQRNGKTEEEIQAYRRAIAISPLDRASRDALGDALVGLGNYDEALKQYRTIASQSPAAFVKKLQIDIAKNLRLPQSQRRWDDIEREIVRMSDEHAGDTSVRLLQVQFLLAAARFDEAITLLRDLRSQYPDRLEYWVFSADLATQRQEQAEVRAILAEAEKVHGDKVPLRLARGRSLMLQEGQDTAQQIRSLADDVDKFTTEDRANLWQGLIPLSLACSDQSLAVELCQRLTRQQPDDPNAWMKWLAVAIDQGDMKSAESLMEQVERTSRGGSVAFYCRATLLAAKNEPTAALEAIKSALAVRPKWLPALLLAAQLEEAQGQLDSALERCLSAIDAGATEVGVFSRAVRLLYRRGKYQQAAELLDRIGQQQVSADLGIQRLHSLVSGQLDDLDEALRAAANVAATSKDYRDQVWFGQLLQLKGARAQDAGVSVVAKESLERAEQVLRAAREQATDAPETWVALLRLLAASERTTEIQSLLSEAVTAFGKDGPSVSLAQCQLAAGDSEAAYRTFAELLARSPLSVDIVRQAAEFCIRTERPQMALPQLRDVADGRIPAERADQIWCRRTLALALSERVSQANSSEALELLQRNLELDPRSVLDRRAKAILLADLRRPTARQDAIQILEELLREGTPDEAATRDRLAQLYLAAGDWEKSLVYLRSATDSRVLAVYVRESMDRNLMAEAERGLNRLEHLYPGQVDGVVLRAELQARNGKVDESLQVLAALVNRSTEKMRKDTLLAAARAAERFAVLVPSKEEQGASELVKKLYLARAESCFLTRAELGADEQVELAAYLARQHEFERAFQVLEQAVGKATAPAIAIAVASFADNLAADSPFGPRLESVIAAALERCGEQIALLDSRVRLYSAWERWDELEALYRDAIGRDGKNFAAKNNLAELLALRGRNLDEALTLVEGAIELVGPDPTMLDTRALVRMARREFGLAREDMRCVVEQAPLPSRYVHLAQSFDGDGLETDAAEAMRRARELNVQEQQMHPLERGELARLKSKYWR